MFCQNKQTHTKKKTKLAAEFYWRKNKICSVEQHSDSCLQHHILDKEVEIKVWTVIVQTKCGQRTEENVQNESLKKKDNNNLACLANRKTNMQAICNSRTQWKWLSGFNIINYHPRIDLYVTIFNISNNTSMALHYFFFKSYCDCYHHQLHFNSMPANSFHPFLVLSFLWYNLLICPFMPIHYHISMLLSYFI